MCFIGMCCCIILTAFLSFLKAKNHIADRLRTVNLLPLLRMLRVVCRTPIYIYLCIHEKCGVRLLLHKTVLCKCIMLVYVYKERCIVFPLKQSKQTKRSWLLMELICGKFNLSLCVGMFVLIYSYSVCGNVVCVNLLEYECWVAECGECVLTAQRLWHDALHLVRIAGYRRQTSKNILSKQQQ